MTAVDKSLRGQAGLPSQSRTIPVIAFGWSLSLFFLISYVICIIGYLLFPGLPINHAALQIYLPGFQLLTWASFFVGLIESFAYG